MGNSRFFVLEFSIFRFGRDPIRPGGFRVGPIRFAATADALLLRHQGNKPSRTVPGAHLKQIAFALLLYGRPERVQRRSGRCVVPGNGP